MTRKPGERTPQQILHDIVIPALGREMCKGNEGQQMARLDYTSSPVERVTWLTVTTDAGDALGLVITPRGDAPWVPKVLVVPDDYTPDPRGSSIEWGRADIVVNMSGAVLKNKYGPTGDVDDEGQP